MRSGLPTSLTAILCITGVGSAMPGPDDVPLIPRAVLFGNPDRASVQISPDGRMLSYLAPVDGVLNVWVAPLDDIAAARPVTSDTDRGIRSYFWGYTDRHILYAQDKGGDENWRIFSVDLETGDETDLTPFENVAARVQQVSPNHPEEILVAINNRTPMLHDIYRANIRSGELSLVQENPGFMGFVTDDAYRVRYASRFTPDGGTELLMPDGDGGWDVFERIPMEDTMGTSPRGFDRAGRVLYMSDSRGRDTAALFAADTETGERRLLAEDERADAGGVLAHPRTGKLQAVSFNYKRVEWRILDESIRDDFDFLGRRLDGEVVIAGRSQDDTDWIVADRRDDGPVRYYHYDRAKGDLRFLFNSRDALEGLPLAPMRPVVIEARDGLAMVSYLTLPVWSARSGDAVPAEPLPMVLNVHGGPWARDSWGYNPVHQWLANRGYAVLSVNFRGSTGFGKDFLNAGNLEWGRAMHDDLIDAVYWAAEAGIADPERVAIYGGSYGGYAALAGLTFTPEVFACGVSVVGPSNLITLLETIPPYWAPMMELFRKRVGDPTTEEGRALLRERSPLNHVVNIRRPLLIGQGANDPRVKQSESDQIVEAMQERGIPVTYALYPDEGHGFARPENRFSFFAITESFFAEILGGRREPLSRDDFENSSMTVPEGAEHVPGLARFLANEGGSD